MPAWQGKSKGKPLGYRIFVSVLKAGGVTPAYILLRFVTLYYLIFSYKTSRHTFSYFRKRHGYGVVKSVFKVYQNYNFLGQSLIDKTVVMAGIPNKFTFNFDGIDNLRKIAALGNGGMLLTSHIGNWEAASHLIEHIDAVINIVKFDGEDEQIKKYMESVTGKSKVNFIIIKEDMSHIFEISNAFLNNELVCMPADRFMEGNKTITMPFLGADAKFPAGPFTLASRFKVPVCFVYAMKETSLHYHFFGSEIKEYLHLDRDALQQQLATDFVADMEIKVKRYPEQWYNYYDFWE